MKPPRMLTPSAWKLAPKFLFAFIMTAIIPLTAASVFSLNFFYQVSFDRARENLGKDLGIAAHYLSEKAERLVADTRLAAHENVVTLNLALGLTAPVTEYLEGLKSQRRLALAEVLDQKGQPLELTVRRNPSGVPVVSEHRLSEALEAGETSFYQTMEDGRILLLALVPLGADIGLEQSFLIMGTDPGASSDGGSLDLIRQVVSGPVVFGGPGGILGRAPGDPPWPSETPWPAVAPQSKELTTVHYNGSTYLFGFEPAGPGADTPGWVGVGFSLDQFSQVTSEAAKGLIAIALISLALAFGAAVVFSRFLTRPLLRMAAQAGTWDAGQSGLRLEVTTQDETGLLGQAFNQLLDRLDETLFSLRKTQNYLKNIFNSLSSVLVSVDEAGRVQEWNTAAELFTGLKDHQALGRNIQDLSPLFLDLQEPMKKALDSRKPQFLKKDLGHGRDRQSFDLCLYPLVWNGVSGVVIRMDDITESMKKDLQIRQAQKMETVGTLTEGIAHNFNNLLTGITGSVSLVELDIHTPGPLDPEELQQHMAMIGESTRKASDMVRQLMSLSRGSPEVYTAIDLVSAMGQVTKMSRMVLDSTVEVKTHIVPSRAVIHGDQSQMEQSLLNLIINASHAMTIMRGPKDHKGGIVILQLLEAVSSEDIRMAHPEAESGDYWKLQVQDTGVGISQENLSRIFDPFFTTKDVDKGSGLGLAMVYTTVKQHGGFIEVYSEVGRGTTFSLYLPVLRDTSPDTQDQHQAKAPQIHRGLGLILVVDDEPMVQKMACTILEKCGYKVVTANNGLEALEVHQRLGKEIQAVLLDSSMPKLSGPETLDKLLERDPGIRVVMSSGLHNDPRVIELAAGSSIKFLPKPYSLTDLSKVFHELLKEPS